MACVPKFTSVSAADNTITFNGTCEGKCEDGDECQPHVELVNDGKHNKGASSTGQGSGGGLAWLRISIDDDVSEGLVRLYCYCGGKPGPSTEHSFSADHETTGLELLRHIVTLFLDVLVTKLAPQKGHHTSK